MQKIQLRRLETSARQWGAGSLRFLLSAWLALTAWSLPGQTPEEETPPPGVIFSGDHSVHVVAPPAAVNRPAGPDAASPAKSPEEQQLQKLLALKFDRSPASVLTALGSRLEKSSGATNVVDRLKDSVSAGDWKEMEQILRALPGDHGKQVYRHVLRELPNAFRPGGQSSMPGQPGMPVQMGNHQPGPANQLGPTLVVSDVLALAAVSPHDLEDEDARLLGRLLARLLGRGDALAPFLAALERGVRGMGGAQPADRARAAELLVAADRVVEAGPFIVPLEVAREKLDWRALDLRARQLVALGKKGQGSKAFQQAWEVNQFILTNPNSAPTNREPAVRRAFELVPLVAGESGTNWLRDSFSKDPRQGLAVLSALHQVVQQGMNDRNLDQRQANLELQQQVVQALLSVVDGAQPHYKTALGLLAQNWVAEASYSRQRHQPRRNRGPQYDEFGNMMYFEQPQPFMDPNQIPPVPAEKIILCAPPNEWLNALDDSLRLGILLLQADLLLKAEQPEKAIALVEAVAALHPGMAQEPANELLRVWGRTRNPNQQQFGRSYGPYGTVYYGPGSPYGMRAPGAPLTRLMQVRNIRELSDLLRRLEAMKLERIDETAMVTAFASAHSAAEVFRIEDIERVFAPLETARLDTIAALSQTMRERLASQWRQARLQQEAKTQRNDKQIEAEVRRGYDLVLQLLDRGLQRGTNHWGLHLARAATFFDLAEFLYGKKVDLAIYVEKREEAFRGFERAAALYAADLLNIEEKEQTPQVYQQWFNATLGASDLAYVTRQQEPATNQLQRIRAAMLALPGAAAERHLAAFAKSLDQSVNTLRGELKPRFLRAGLKITGDHPEAEPARKLVAGYDGLLQEIEFVVRLDGDANVGHGQPFGLFVSLHHSAEIEREAGGFSRYLLNPKKSSPYYYYPQQSQQQRSFLDAFEQQVREKLMKHFEIKAIVFLDEKVQSRGIGRDRWRETPLAYLLLQAKDGAVDQLPAFQMDLDFADQRGQVVLPVESQIILVDARSTGIPRPVRDLEITQILDDRELPDGKLALEIKATGKGLVPALEQLVSTNFGSLEVKSLADQGISVSQIDTEGDSVAPVSERTWLVNLQVPKQQASSIAFQFPKAARESAKMIFKRYSDADLVEVEPTLALAGVALRRTPVWYWVLPGAVLLLAAGAGVVLWRRRVGQTEIAPASVYQRPAALTPFAVLSLLRRMQADSSIKWPGHERSELADAIRTLEGHYFERRSNGTPEPDLRRICDRWLALTHNGK